MDEFTRTTHSLHWYDSVLVIEKRLMSKPTDRRTGAATVPDYASPGKQAADRFKSRLKRAIGIKDRSR